MPLEQLKEIPAAHTECASARLSAEAFAFPGHNFPDNDNDHRERERRRDRSEEHRDDRRDRRRDERRDSPECLNGFPTCIPPESRS